MAAQDETPFVVPLQDAGWRAELEVAPPTVSRPAPANFDVPVAGGGPLRRITARVLYTKAADRANQTGWKTWHVKIYHCENPGDADTLRGYLRSQAKDIRDANAYIDGPARLPIKPPWAVAPVHIIAGDRSADPGQAPPTEPGARAEEIINRIRTILPPWFGIDNPAPELFLLAFSPWLDKVRWELHLTLPGTEQLEDFRGMAKGLDTLHAKGTAHCDIKPDNVCRYHSADGSGYALIDADAAMRMDPSPKAPLRTTQPYVYKGVRDWQKHDLPKGIGLAPGLMRAQDRFGFALVVLVALAGKDWVELDLLNHPYDNGAKVRRPDNRSTVVEALRLHWRDPSWEPLIQAAAAPFGPEIEKGEWSAAEWIEQLVEAQRESARLASTREPKPQTDRLDPDLQTIREYARAVPTPRLPAERRGYEALARRANAVAARAAVYYALACAAVPVVVVLVVLISAFGLGK